MTRCMYTDSPLADKPFLILKPVIRVRLRSVRNIEGSTLHFKVVPQWLVRPVQAERRASRLLNLAGSQEVIEVSMGMDYRQYSQPQLLHVGHYLFRVTTWVNDDGISG